MTRATTLLAIVALLAGACGGSGTTSTDADQPTTTTTQAAPATTAASPTTGAAPETTVPPTTEAAPGSTVATTGQFLTTARTGLGEVLIDEDGNALYLFLPDAQGASTCSGGCAVTWPPVLLVGDTMPAGAGVDPALIGSIERPDGTLQATYNDWPLYRYLNDMDTDGQGLGGNWWVVSPDGEPVM